MVLRAVYWTLLAGLFLESITLALPLVAPDYSRSSLTSKNYRHTLGDSLVVRNPQILTASDLGTRDIALQRQRYEDAYQKMGNCYQDLQAGSLSLCTLHLMESR